MYPADVTARETGILIFGLNITILPFLTLDSPMPPILVEVFSKCFQHRGHSVKIKG